MEDTGPCGYHGREACKACKAFHFALVAHRSGKEEFGDRQLDKAVALEAEGI